MLRAPSRVSFPPMNPLAWTNIHPLIPLSVLSASSLIPRHSSNKLSLKKGNIDLLIKHSFKTIIAYQAHDINPYKMYLGIAKESSNKHYDTIIMVPLTLTCFQRRQDELRHTIKRKLISLLNRYCLLVHSELTKVASYLRQSPWVHLLLMICPALQQGYSTVS